MNDKVINAMNFLHAAKDVRLDELDAAFHGVSNLQTLCHELSRKAGWWDRHAQMAAAGFEMESFAVKHNLIHSELSETLEGLRKGKNDDHLPHRKAVEVELADAVIRIMDLGGAMGLDVAGAIIEKMAYNQTREDHTKEHRNADGGKKF